MVAVKLPGPESVGQVALERDPGSRATGEDFGAQIGRSLAEFGAVAASLGENMRKKYQAAEDETFLQKYQLEANASAYKTMLDNEPQAIQGPEAFSNLIDKSLEKSLSDIQTRIMKEGGYRPSKEALRRAQGLQYDLRTNYMTKSLTAGNNAKVAKLASELESNIDTITRSVAEHGELGDASAAVDQALATASKVMAPDVLEKVRVNAKNGLGRSLAEYLNGFQDRALNAKTDQERQANVQAVNDLVDDAMDRGYISPESGAKFKREWSQGYKIRILETMPAEERKKALSIPKVGAKGDRAKAAMNYFVSQGFTREQSAGIIGNLIQESGLRTNARNPKDPGTSEGLGQWNRERKAALKSFAASKGKPWTDFQTQLEFVVHELNTTEKTAGQKLRQARTVDEATAAMIGYERPVGWSEDNPRGGHGWSNRLRNAHGVLGNKVQINVADTGETMTDAGENFFGDLPPDKQQAISDQADKEISASYIQAATQRREQIDLGVATGQVTDIRTILDDPIIDDGDKAKLVRRLEKKQQDANSIRDVVARLNDPGAIFDPSEGSGDRKAVNAIYSEGIAAGAVAQGDEQAVNRMVGLWRKTGMAPKQAKGELAGMLRSNDTAVMTTGLSLLDAMERDRPDAFKREFDEATEKALSIWREGLDYYSPEEIRDRLKQSNDPQQIKAKETLKAQIKKDVDKLTFDDVASQFSRLFPSWFTLYGAPDAPVLADQAAQMLNDYKSLLLDHFAETGNMDQAEKEASARFARVWGESQVNGGRLMKKPPEFYIPRIDQSYEWATDQIKEALDELGLVKPAPSFMGVDLEALGVDERRYPDYGLVADKKTDAEISAGNLPSYQLWIMNEDGMPERAMKDGKEVRIGFDPKKANADAQIRREKERAEGLENLKRAEEALQPLQDQMNMIPSLQDAPY